MRTVIRLAFLLSFAVAAHSPVLLAAPPAISSETQVRQLLMGWEKAFRAKDVDAVMRVYASGAAVVAYDVVPPLARIGRDAYRKNYEEFFAMYGCMRGRFKSNSATFALWPVTMSPSSTASSESLGPSRAAKNRRRGFV